MEFSNWFITLAQKIVHSPIYDMFVPELFWPSDTNLPSELLYHHPVIRKSAENVLKVHKV